MRGREVERQTGLEGFSLGYASKSRSMHLKDHAIEVAASIRKIAGPNRGVYLVTHSMGGILARVMQGLPQAGGVRWCGCVQLAPPNKGSVLARTLSKTFGERFFTAICGKAFTGCNGKKLPLMLKEIAMDHSLSGVLHGREELGDMKHSACG